MIDCEHPKPFTLKGVVLETGRGKGRRKVGVMELVGEQKEEEGEGRGQTARGQLLITTTPSCPRRADWSKARGSDKACRHTPIPFQLESPQSAAAAQIFDYHLAASAFEVKSRSGKESTDFL